MSPHNPDKRKFFRRTLGGLGALLLAGCDRISGSEWFPKVMSAGESLSKSVHKTLVSRKSMAQEFSEADLSPQFRSNGTSNPDNPAYQAMAGNNFADWSLKVDGLVEKPRQFSLAQLRALPSRTQITRHDCVEGWSAIGKWTGVQLSQILAAVRPAADARFVVFHCADPMESNGKDLYYESIDMDDAYHPQTILAYDLNGKMLPVANGAPIRLRVERQLGYKHAKYLMRVELVNSFEKINGGKGGYWEDSNDYQWYAGI
ncbi:MAG: oxidoreductase molybdopterin binding domain protein [Herminiimonas sp.]|nr:oxidoreductase molybdopterin binding domain protein [Herminiimonas sp.]